MKELRSALGYPDLGSALDYKVLWSALSYRELASALDYQGNLMQCKCTGIVGNPQVNQNRKKVKPTNANPNETFWRRNSN